ncbi:MAG: VPLPA-CTERM sorting domain-containing protein [Gammaproteobacteria bacterium]
MKAMKLKMLAAAVALAGASAAATAAPIAPEGVFLSVRDEANNNSFVANLNVTTADFRADDTSPRALSGQALDALSQFLSGRDLSTIVWNVTGAMNGDYGTPTWGGMTTSTNIETAPQDWGHFGGLDAAVQNYQIFRGVVNPDLAGSVDGVGYNTGDLKGYFTPGGNGGVGSIESLGRVGDTLAFYAFFVQQPNDGFTEFFEGDFAKLAGQWTLDFDGATASLNYAPVPLPAGVWLLGSALAGVAGVVRRRKA